MLDILLFFLLRYQFLECKYEMCKCRFLHQHTCNNIFQEEEEEDTEVEENKGEEGEEGKEEERGKEEEVGKEEE